MSMSDRETGRLAVFCYMHLRVLLDRRKNLRPNNPWFLFDGERKIIDRKWLCDRGCEWSFHLAPACGPTPEVKSGAIHQINNGKSIVYRGEEAPYRHLIIILEEVQINSA